MLAGSRCLSPGDLRHPYGPRWVTESLLQGPGLVDERLSSVWTLCLLGPGLPLLVITPAFGGNLVAGPLGERGVFSRLPCARYPALHGREELPASQLTPAGSADSGKAVDE